MVQVCRLLEGKFFEVPGPLSLEMFFVLSDGWFTLLPLLELPACSSSFDNNTCTLSTSARFTYMFMLPEKLSSMIFFPDSGIEWLFSISFASVRTCRSGLRYTSQSLSLVFEHLLIYMSVDEPEMIIMISLILHRVILCTTRGAQFH